MPPRFTHVARVFDCDQDYVGRDATDILEFFPYRVDDARFRRAMALVVAQFPEVSSQLVEWNGRFGIAATPEPLPLSVRTADEPFISPASPDDLDKHLDRVFSLPGAPLCTVRITHVPNGTLVGSSVSHILADGITYNGIVAHLMAAFHGSAVPQAFRRSTSRLFREIERGEWYDGERYFAPGADPASWRKPPRGKTHGYYRELSPDSLSELRRGHRVSDGVSDAAVMMALLMKYIAPRMFPAAERIRARVPVDARRCFPNGVNQSFGNGYIDAFLAFEAGELETLALDPLAQTIFQAIAARASEIEAAGVGRITGRPLGEQDWFLNLWRKASAESIYNRATDLSLSYVGRSAVTADYGEGGATDAVVAASNPNAFGVWEQDRKMRMTILCPNPLNLDDIAGLQPVPAPA